MSARPTCQSLKLLRAEKCASAPQGTLNAMQSEDFRFSSHRFSSYFSTIVKKDHCGKYMSAY